MLASVAVLAQACTAAPQSDGGPASSSVPTTTSSPVELTVEVVASGLEHPWDIEFVPASAARVRPLEGTDDQAILLTQRPGKLTLISGDAPDATVTEVRADFSDVMVRFESGLLGMAVYPDFAESRRFVTCQTHLEGGDAVDVRLVTWELSPDGRSATRVGPLLTGLPINPSGRHSGCRPRIGPDGALFVGTGDTASDPDIPQSMTSLGGKVLRIDLRSGEALPDNPFVSSDNPVTRQIYTYGHRNVQGVTVRPDSGAIFITEHGPTHHDEISKLVPGGNYGWDPSKGGTTDDYEEDVPMTDMEDFPEAVPPVWNSGDDTLAPSGADFINGEQWGSLDGALAVAGLRGQQLMLFTLDKAGNLTKITVPPPLNGEYGRLRAVRSGPNGALYVATSNGDDDKLLRITPA